MDRPGAVGTERNGDLILESAERGRARKSAVERFHFFEERLKLVRSQIRSEAATKPTNRDLNFAVDPVAVRRVEETGMSSRKRANEDVLRIDVADDDFSARCHTLSVRGSFRPHRRSRVAFQRDRSNSAMFEYATPDHKFRRTAGRVSKLWCVARRPASCAAIL